MKRTSSVLAGLALLAVLPFTFTSCASSHLVRWSFDKSSSYREHDTEAGNSVLKPTVTVIGLPITAVWDIATFPFQMIWGIYPWGDTYLDPQQAKAKTWVNHPRWVDAVMKNEARWADAMAEKARWSDAVMKTEK